MIVRSGEDIMLRKKARVMTPGEMEKITIDAGRVTGDVFVCVEREG